MYVLGLFMGLGKDVIILKLFYEIEIIKEFEIYCNLCFLIIVEKIKF